MKNILITFNMVVVLIMTTITGYCIDPPKEKKEIDLADRAGNNFDVEASESHNIGTPYKGGDGTDFDLWDVWDRL